MNQSWLLQLKTEKAASMHAVAASMNWRNRPMAELYFADPVSCGSVANCINF